MKIDVESKVSIQSLTRQLAVYFQQQGLRDYIYFIKNLQSKVFDQKSTEELYQFFKAEHEKFESMVVDDDGNLEVPRSGIYSIIGR